MDLVGVVEQQQPQHYCLRWNNHLPNLGSVFSGLLEREVLVDVTLTSEGRSIKCHKVVLSACSPYFEQLFIDNETQHPIIILKDIRWSELRYIVEYMYRGEISVSQEDIENILQAAEALQVRGLVNLNGEKDALATSKLSEAAFSHHHVHQPEHPLHHHPHHISRQHHQHQQHPEDLRTGDLLTSSSPSSLLSSPSPAPKKRRTTTTATISRTDSISSSLSPEPEPLSSASPAYSSSSSHIHLLHSSPTQSDSDLSMVKSEPEPTDLRLNSSLNSSSSLSRPEGSKVPTWSQTQLQEAIEAVITQRMRFTQASSKYGIPKGTLYDNILGKSKRMQVLDELELNEVQELAVLEFCCEVSSMPYNRRTSRSLRDIVSFITKLKRDSGQRNFEMSTRQGFRWWWAFTKKHSIISLYYENQTGNGVGDAGGEELPPATTKSFKRPSSTSSPGDNKDTVLNLSTSQQRSSPSPSSTTSTSTSSFSLLVPFLTNLSPSRFTAAQLGKSYAN